MVVDEGLVDCHPPDHFIVRASMSIECADIPQSIQPLREARLLASNPLMLLLLMTLVFAFLVSLVVLALLTW